MRIPGSLLFWLTLSLVWGGEVSVRLQKNPITLSEPAQLIIEAFGDEIHLPKIERIGGYPVASGVVSESVQKMDGKLVVVKKMVLTFYPDENVTIGPVTVKVDGKEYRSDPIKLGVIKKLKKDAYVTFTLEADKKAAYVGEPILLDMVLKIHRGLDIINYDFIPPRFEGFWVEELEDSGKYLQEHGDYLIKRTKFLLLPQKPGRVEVPKALFRYAVPQRMSDSFGFSITAPKWSSIFSNPLEFTIKPLPADVDLVGDFRLRVTADKKRIEPNEPLNLAIRIEGEGNMEGFEGIKLQIPDATVYEEPPKKEVKLVDGKIRSSFEQRFSIISDRSFTIPAIKIAYFSLQKERLEYLRHDPIRVEVEGNSSVGSIAKSGGSGSKSEAVRRDFILFWYGFGAGVGVALLAWGIRLFAGRRRWRWRGKKELLNTLMPHISSDPKAASMAQALYEEIYEGKRSGIGKKEIQKLLQDLMQRRGPLHPGA